MKSLVKVAKPDVLVRKEAEWTRNYVAARGTTEEPKHEKWRHRDIRIALKQETASKCAYCEAYVDDVSFPHVEHMIPKAEKPELAHIWDNLTSACGRCNVAKDRFYHATQGILNPYVDDVSSELRHPGALVQWQLGSVRGEVTVRRLGLNRLELVKARAERMEEVLNLLARWHEARDPLKASLAEALRIDAAEGEFSQSVASLLHSCRFPLTDDLSAATGVEPDGRP